MLEAAAVRCRRRQDTWGRAAEAGGKAAQGGMGRERCVGVRGVREKALGLLACPSDFSELGDPRLDLGDPSKEGSRSAPANPSEKQHAGCFSSLLLMAII